MSIIGTVKNWIESNDIVYQYYNHNSQYESIVKEWLEEFKIDYESNNRSLLNPKEIDILIPSKNIGIEINGFYWHAAKSQEEIVSAKFRHQEKSLACLEKGILLIHLSDIQIKSDQDKIKQYLKNRLITLNKIGARECSISTIQTQQAREFCEKYHLQNYTGASVKLGLFYKNELVSLMTFSKSRFNQSVWEIIRSCSSSIKVIGGVSRLIRFFIKNYMKENEKLISYVNLGFGFSGISYEKSGMNLERITTPGYVWVNKNEQQFSRYQFQPYKLKNYFSDYCGESENEFLFNKKMLKLYDSGHLVYSFIK
jgi:hypothetical protein